MDSSVGELLQRAARCGETCDFAEARQLYERILETVPEHAEAWYRLGLLDCREGRFDAGVDHIGRAALHFCNQLGPLDCTAARRG